MVPMPGAVSGDILFEGRDVGSLDEKDLRAMRGSKLSMIFQDPMTSLNPFLPVWVQIAEVTREHLGYSRAEARDHAVHMQRAVGIPDAASGRRISAPVLGRHAAARDDRYLACLQAKTPDRGRTYNGP